MRRALIASTFVLLVGAVVAQQTRHVPAQFATIQAAIVASSGGDIVLVAPGTYIENINFLGRAITVKSSGGAPSTTIRGSSAARVVTFATNEGPGSKIEGFTIKWGNGGILCQRSSPQIVACIIRANFSTTSGGGIRCLADVNGSSASPSIVDCTIIDNTAGNGPGGGIVIETSGTGSSAAIIQNCEIATNTCQGSSSPRMGGGGIYAFRSSGSGVLSPVITASRIHDNTALNYGGGVAIDSGTLLTLERCRIERNSVLPWVTVNSFYSQGGGVFVSEASVRINNCFVTENDAVSLGGGILVASGIPATATIQNSTVSGNTAPIGAAIFAALPTTVVGSILWGNDGIEVYEQSGSTMTVSGSDIAAVQHLGVATNFFADPLFVDPTSGDYHLSALSPCIGAGLLGPLSTPSTDFDGTARIVGAAIDVGADEFPSQQFPGSAEDLDIYVKVNGEGDPLASQALAALGDLVHVLVRTPGGTFAGTSFLLAGEVGPTGYQPYVDPFFPYVHLYPTQAFILAGDTYGGPFAVPGLPPQGMNLYYQIPAGLAGYTVRLQGFAVTTLAANGIFACSNARDVVL